MLVVVNICIATHANVSVYSVVQVEFLQLFYLHLHVSIVISTCVFSSMKVSVFVFTLLLMYLGCC